MFSNNKMNNFQFEIFEYAKHHRTSFPRKPYKPSQTFTLIHSDIWDSSHIPNRTQNKWFVTFINDQTRMC